MEELVEFRPGQRIKVVQRNFGKIVALEHIGRIRWIPPSGKIIWYHRESDGKYVDAEPWHCRLIDDEGKELPVQPAVKEFVVNLQAGESVEIDIEEPVSFEERVKKALSGN